MAEESQIVHPNEPKSLAGGPESGVRNGPFLVVGLGNPGLEYLWTPHNAGFMAIDRIAQQEGVVVANRRCEGRYRNLPHGGARGGPGQAGDVYEPERAGCGRAGSRV